MSERNSIIYSLRHNGDLMWFHHNGNNDGSFMLASDQGKKVGHGVNFKQVFSGGEGIIYAINENKDLMWGRHEGRNDGSFAWTTPNMQKVGHSWNFKQVFSGGEGIIYAINDNNDLMWARHEGRYDGSFTWATSEMQKVGHSWNFKQVFSGGEGIIYAINDNNDLMWARHEGRYDGSFRWTSDMKKVATGWNFSQVFSGMDGVIYAIKFFDLTMGRHGRPPTASGGELLWYRHEGRNDGTDRWAAGSGKQVSDRWTEFSTVFSGDSSYPVYGAIGDRYAQLGGSNSWLGRPTADEQPFLDDGRVQTFENGVIYWWPDIGARDLNNVVVHYTGLHCFAETDFDQIFSDDDEPYATIGVAGPEGAMGTFRSQIHHEVDAGEGRFEVIELYNGKPRGLVITAVLQERSGGDTEVSRKVVKEAVEKGGTALAGAATAIPGVGFVLGPLAMYAHQLIKGDITNLLNYFLENTLGFADRPLGTDIIELTPKQMVILATRPEGHAQFGPIPWRFETRLLERFGASYKVYFNIFGG